jgi:hypothetical protein
VVQAQSASLELGAAAEALVLRASDAPRPLHSREIHQEHTAARKLAKEYFERYPKDRYQTVESSRNLQSANIEFTMKRLREPIEG